jgi:hypothetical protein
MMHVPLAALAAVVVSVCYNLVEIVVVRRLYDLRRGEFFQSMVETSSNRIKLFRKKTAKKWDKNV